MPKRVHCGILTHISVSLTSNIGESKMLLHILGHSLAELGDLITDIFDECSPFPKAHLIDLFVSISGEGKCIGIPTA